MLDDLFQADNLKAAADLVARPAPLPKPAGPAFSLGSLLTAAPRGVATGAAQSGGFFADVLGAFGDMSVASGMGDPLLASPDKQVKAAEKIQREGLDFTTGDPLREFGRQFQPDAATAHVAERLVFDLSRFVTKAVGYTAAGGPVVGPAFVGADEALTTSDELRRQGVDLGTRSAAGAVVGAVSALGVGLPMAGRTALGTAGLVALGGPVSFVGQQAAVRKILQDADYSKLGEQYDPFDPVGLAISTLVPAAFGVHGLRVNKAAAAAKAAEDFRTGPVPSVETATAAAAREATMRPDDEHVDAARTLLAVEERQRSNPFRPDDMRAYDVHEQALTRAIDQIASGQPVHVAEIINAPDLTAARAVLDQIDTLQAERAALLPEAGQLAENGAIRSAREELRMMERQQPAASESDIKALAKEIQTLQGVSYKAALAEAQVQAFTARQERLQQAIETNAKAQQATQQVVEIDRRIATLEQQLGPESKLAQFERTLTTNLRALAEQTAPAQRATGAAADATTPTPRPAAEAQPKATDAGSLAAPRQAQAGAPAAGSSAAKTGLVDDGAAARVAQVEIDYPGLMVQLDGMDAPRPLAEVMAAVKAEADDMLADSELMQQAAACALLNLP